MQMEQSTNEVNSKKRSWQRLLLFEAIAKREYQSMILGLADECGIGHPTYFAESSPEPSQRQWAQIRPHLELEP
jgi:hypothetical protein